MGDLYRVNSASIDLDKPLQRVDVGTLLASGDSNADRFQTIVTRGGKPVDLTGYEVKAYFIRPSKDTAEVDGVIDGGSTALVVLPAACYKYSGIFSLAVKVKAGEDALTLCIFDGYIKQTQVGGVVDHNDTLPSLEHIMELLERMEDAADRTEEAAKDAQTTVATTAPAIEKTASGAVVTIADAAARPALSVLSEIRCLQLGGTEATPDNVKPIYHPLVQLYHGAAHDTAAEPVATASLPDVAFGGSYDWATGAVTVTKYQYVPKGADITSYGTASTGVPYVQLTLPEAWAGSGALCSHYRVVSGAPSSAAIRLVAPVGCYIYDPRFADRATAAALLDAEKVQIVYDLQEAKAVQVEPVGLMLQKGVNDIWSGVGDTSVRYVVDTKTYVDAHAGGGGAGVDEVARAGVAANEKGIAALSEEIEQLKQSGGTGDGDDSGGATTVIDTKTVSLPTLVKIEDTYVHKVDGADVQIFGFSNMFNKDAWLPNKRYDDSGVEITNTSSGYVNQFVPVNQNVFLYSNVAIERFYEFDKDKNFIKRGASFAGGQCLDLRANITSNTRYLMFQFLNSVVSSNLETAVITLTDDGTYTPTEYQPFSITESKDGTLYAGENLIRSETATTATITTYDGVMSGEGYDGRTQRLFSQVDVWEPESVDEGYSTPTSGWGSDTNRADWAAENKYTYYDFLAAYYDKYIGTQADGYRVVKRSLGQDCGKSGHEIFEYDFCPVNYKYTVLLSAGMNANETQGIWGLATFMRGVMEREETNLSIAHDNIRFKVIPIINASGFDRPTLQYNYVDGVNPNFNFNYRNSWSQHTSTEKGEYPDSNVATVMLKKWINDNSGCADLWLDLHTGRWEVSGDTNKTIMDIRLADSSMSSAFAPYVELIKQHYIDKGYISDSDAVGGTNVIRNNQDYQKTVYAFDVCGIPSIMPEMHLESTGYGTDGYTNNAPNGIKAYVLQIRAMVMAYINAAAGRAYALDGDKDARFHARYR